MLYYLRRTTLAGFTEVRWEATNSAAQLRALFFPMGYGRQAKDVLAEIDFITKAGDGYEVVFDQKGLCEIFVQLQHKQFDGLFADFNNNRNRRCEAWMRYKKGKAVAKYLVWNEKGSLYMEAKIKKPHVLLRHLGIPAG